MAWRGCDAKPQTCHLHHQPHLPRGLRRQWKTNKLLFEQPECLLCENTMIYYHNCDALVLPSLRRDRVRGAHGKRSSHLVAAYNALLDTSCRTLPI